MNIEQVCRTCLNLNGPFLSIFEANAAGNAGCIAEMVKEFTNNSPVRTDNLPGKVCLSCISEINHCYSFKLKCENSLRTLCQLLPNAAPEQRKEANETTTKQTAQTCHQATQTINLEVVKPHTTNSATSPMKIDVTPLWPAKKRKLEVVQQQEQEQQEEQQPTIEQIDFVEVETNQDHLVEAEFFIELQDGLQDEEEEEEHEHEENVVALALSDDASTSSQAALNLATQQNVSYIEVTDSRDNLSMDKKQIYAVKANNASYKVGIEEQTFLAAAQKLHHGEVRQNAAQTQLHKLRHNIKDYAACMSIVPTQKENNDDDDDAEGEEEAEAQADVEADHEQDTETAQDDYEVDNDETEQKSQHNNSADDVAMEQAGGGGGSSQHSSIEFNFFCSICKAGFAEEKSLEYHYKLRTCGKPSFQCSECHRVFNSKQNLLKHKATHYLSYVCNECNEIFDNAEQLSDHKVEMHQRSKRNQCQVCKKVFTMISALRDHERIHSGEKPFECELCDKKFSQMSNLKQHLMRHNRQKQFKCEDCANSYVTKAELLSHQRIHTGEQPFKCDMCDSKYTSSSSLAKHKRTHTGERPYGCEMCPMRFASLNVLKNHRRTHTGEKPFQCRYCQKNFTQKGDCAIHERTHTGERNYHCRCGSSFAHLATLRQHVKAHLMRGDKMCSQVLNNKTKQQRSDSASDEEDMENKEFSKTSISRVTKTIIIKQE